MVQDRVCIVTGSNKGVGLAAVRQLCTQFDGIVYLTSRDEGIGQTAVRELQEEGLSPRYHQLDINDKQSIERFAKHIQDCHNGLDVLINNAAIKYRTASSVPLEEQVDQTMGVNYFATKNLCHSLFPLLRPHARVVNVSSSCGLLSYVNGDEPRASLLRAKLASPSLTEEGLDELMRDFMKHAKDGDWSVHGWQKSAYVVSKVGLSALTRVQQRNFDEDSREDLVVNSCHPGYVNTNMSSFKGPLTPDEGASCPVYLAFLPPGTDIKGEIVSKSKQVVDWIQGTMEL